MIVEGFENSGDSSKGMYIRNALDIPPKWKNIENSHIPLNWNDMRSIVDIPKLYAIASKRLKTKADIVRMAHMHA